MSKKQFDLNNIERSSDNQNNTLERLIIFDRLEVGPVKLEPQRLVAPYRLVQNNKEDYIQFIARYEEDVFDPHEYASQNLASLIAAQVAINYGLFCRSIVFHGTYDDTDRRLIRDMAENTAREIFVKKFLEANPFLIKEFNDFSVVKKSRYLHSDILFSDTSLESTRPPWNLWATHGKKHAILSSGGKDSLLSFGLINEIKKETHPIFVNESGRHWFTAMNAYRYFKENVPRTARVWVNSDRIFSWMLRHMNFIRRDFANIRSDEYPIRLWTVAVFLFAVLPIVKKRGIGRILIGDEFDTSQRTSYRGIPHYAGLYDQSRYFDNALSRYYLRKGWSICQFSVIRPLSELLIEKILVERYPDLQMHQMSCHAAHKDGDRIRPCGRCEKCRRIVGMLLAIEADPVRCGYIDQQIHHCLHELAAKSVHQESAGVQQLTFLLTGKNLISLPKSKLRSIKEHTEILKLRFDPQKSPVNGIPVDLRGPIYRIMLEHANGAVRRAGRMWNAFDLLSYPSLNRPYAFEVSSKSMMQIFKSKGGITSTKNYLWSELTWPEAEQLFKKVDIALLPVGSIEQHGPHLPLDTDSFDADYLARRIAEACSDPKPLILPLVSYGVSYEHDEFKGTISISNDTLSHLVYEIGMSVARNGINKLVIINGHGGNNPALNYAAQMITRDAKIFVCVDTGETSDFDIYKITETPNDVHAGEIETSTSLAVRPNLVRMEKASKLIPKFSSRYLNFTSRRFVSWYAYTKKISQSGVMGDPTRASAEKGEKIWQIMIGHLVSLVEDLKNMTLDEIYQKRY